MSFTCLGFKDNIITFSMDGKEIINPFEVAMQAMLGEAVYEDYKDKEELNLIPRYYALRNLRSCIDDFYAQCAIKWLQKHAIEKEDIYVWEYQYDITYNDELIKAPWISAFGQSYAILAFIYWYKHTNEEKYKKYIINGLNGLIRPIEKGGTLFVNKEFFWFEEIPNKDLTHILNAHLISILTLLEAKKALKTLEYDEYIEDAMSSLIRNMYKYDSGIYSNYEISKIINKVFDFQIMKSNKVLIKAINIYELGQCIYQIKVNTEKAFDSKNHFYISGIDWGQIENEDYRELRNGYKIRKKAIEGGERQNTYLCFRDAKIKADEILIEIEYKVLHDNKIKFYTQNSNGKLVATNITVDLKKDRHMANVTLPVYLLNPYLSEVYHEYHIKLMKEINRIVKNKELKYIVKKFERYSRKKMCVIGGR